MFLALLRNICLLASLSSNEPHHSQPPLRQNWFTTTFHNHFPRIKSSLLRGIESYPRVSQAQYSRQDELDRKHASNGGPGRRDVTQQAREQVEDRAGRLDYHRGGLGFGDAAHRLPYLSRTPSPVDRRLLFDRCPGKHSCFSPASNNLVSK